MSVRQTGQLFFFLRHSPMQCSQKVWPQFTLTASTNSSEQTAHCNCVSASSLHRNRLVQAQSLTKSSEQTGHCSCVSVRSLQKNTISSRSTASTNSSEQTAQGSCVSASSLQKQKYNQFTLAASMNSSEQTAHRNCVSASYLYKDNAN